MEIFRTLLSLGVFFSSGTSLTSSYQSKFWGSFDETPDVCGGYCTGGSNPCFWHSLEPEKKAASEWANDHCWPPYGNGTEWTTTTTTTEKPTKRPRSKGKSKTATRPSVLKESILDDDHSSSESGQHDLPTWAIVLFVIFFLVAVVLSCYRWYYIMQMRQRGVVVGGGVFGGGGYGRGLYGGGGPYIANYPATAMTISMH